MLDLALGIASSMTTNPPGGLVVSAQNPGALWPNYAALWYLVVKGIQRVRQTTSGRRLVALLP